MIPDKLAKEVKALRFTTDKKGRKMPLKKISRQTGLTLRQIKYVLFEKDNIRIIELKEKYYKNSYSRIQSEAFHRGIQESPLNKAISPLS